MFSSASAVSSLIKSFTVNLEIFERVLFSRNFPYAKFSENKTLEKWQNHSVIYLYTFIMPKSRIFNVANMSFNAILEKNSHEHFQIYSIKGLREINNTKHDEIAFTLDQYLTYIFVYKSKYNARHVHIVAIKKTND